MRRRSFVGVVLAWLAGLTWPFLGRSAPAAAPPLREIYRQEPDLSWSRLRMSDLMAGDVFKVVDVDFVVVARATGDLLAVDGVLGIPCVVIERCPQPPPRGGGGRGGRAQ